MTLQETWTRRLRLKTRGGTWARGVFVVAVYTLTIFVSAFLLFLVQPMFTRMVLPALGGSPAVWNTALVFYQATLLGGYLYAHYTTRKLGARKQALLHLALLLLPLLVLPIAMPKGWTPPTSSNPIPWLLGLLSVSVGLPFFVVSTTSPLLQRWFAATGHKNAHDPYFLYAASNAGSMLVLLLYPFGIEPSLKLFDQSRLWQWGYGAMIVLMAGCVFFLWKSPASAAQQFEAPQEAPVEPLSRARIGRWILAALVPSSLMMSVTTYLSTDIAAIPLMWVVPLALYLLTFILVFSRRQFPPHIFVVRAMPMSVLLLVIAIAGHATQPSSLLIPLHLVTFFLIAMLCHGDLARNRPDASRLTEFYLWMSFGGVLGGIFNALIAPLIFDSIAEYPIVLAMSCLFLPLPVADAKSAKLNLKRPAWLPGGWDVRDFVLPLLVGGISIASVIVLQAIGSKPGPIETALMFGVPAFACFVFSRRPPLFALSVAGVLLAGQFYRQGQGEVLFATRSFFGLHRVTLDSTGRYHQIVHGSTIHGMQAIDPKRRREPLAYYHRTGPMGQVFGEFARRSQAPGANRLAFAGDKPGLASLAMGDLKTGQRVAIVGLGAGGLAAYAQAGQDWTFYEIDPEVERLARDERLFSFLHDSPAKMRVVLGDGRRSLTQTRDQYDLLVLDAYSSDSLPVHLATREALQVYLQRLAPGGLLVFNISNRYLDIEPVLGGLAREAGLSARVRVDTNISAQDERDGKTAAAFLVMARSDKELGTLAHEKRWRVLRRRKDAPIWTDNYSSLLSIFTWK